MKDYQKPVAQEVTFTTEAIANNGPVLGVVSSAGGIEFE